MTEIEKQSFFDKYTTNVIKGVALIMMFIHHFFTFPDWWLGGISYPVIEKLSTYFCRPFRLCVGVFCFITGYFYAFGPRKTLKYSIKKIIYLVISYWSVFLIFALIAGFFADYKYTLKSVIAEMAGISRPTMRFCWYVVFYGLFMLILPFVTRLMSRNVHTDLILSLICIPLIITVITNLMPKSIFDETIKDFSTWFPCVLIGHIFADYGLFFRMQKLNEKLVKNKWVNVILWIMLLLITPMGRYLVPRVSIPVTGFFTFKVSLDVLYTPIFIYVLVSLIKAIKIKNVTKPLFYIGKYSLLMWFISCIFFNNSAEIFQPILYLPHNPVLVTLWGLLLCFLPAVILDIPLKFVKTRLN